MANYAWCTDLHLDCLGDDTQKLIKFGESLVKDNPTGVFITGDISIAKKLIYHMSALEQIVKRPVYYVIGNHDVYGAAFEPVRNALRDMNTASQFLRYMPAMPYYSLSPVSAIVGGDGWYDALYGNWQQSGMVLQDWSVIQDFATVNGSKATIVELCRKLAHASVTHVQSGIKQAVRYHKHVVVLTHVPPFDYAHIHEGKIGEPGAQPWFTSQMMGSMLLDASKAYPNHHFNVLCGHTHGKFDAKITANLELHVGGATYGKPELQALINVP